ncbi:hypothetical protein L3Q67_26650 [Saccharothrix sp. AJ9571]|nr:hypothetical protein L3Q67_26650 [Saccharothrix sp. AJ9571]
MTSMGPRTGSDALAPNPAATYDLIIGHGGRIVFHDHYDSPEVRLRVCVGILTCSDIVNRVVDSPRSAEIRDLYHACADQWSTAPNAVVDALAELCRQWGVQIYMSTTTEKSAAPATLFSVITTYGPGQAVAEHFPSRETRQNSLIERAGQFFATPGCIPELVLADERHLAALLAALLKSATVTLTESVLDEADGIYKPSGVPPQIA